MRTQPFGRMTFWLALIVTALVASSLALKVYATSYVMMPDSALADQSPVIIVGRVQGVGVSRASGSLYTDYRVHAERVLKGSLSNNMLIMRVLGGEMPDGSSVRVWGAPRFSSGQRALLFLALHRDGTYRIGQFMLGAFHEVAMDGRRYAVRDLTDAAEISLPNRPHPGENNGARDFDRFAGWLADRSAGRLRDPDYFVSLTPQQMTKLRPQYTLLTSGGTPFRWFEFDTGGSISWFANQNGQPGLAGGGFTEFQQAIQAWNAEPNTPINYVYAGTTASTAGSGDGINAIVFNDPNGEIAGSFNCGSGGTLAIGGVSGSGTGTFKGQTFFRTVEGFVITQDGIDCFFASSPNASKAAEELFGHELGHTLGLGHSCSSTATCSANPVLDEALMRYRIHNDGRGAALNSDDVAGIRFLYEPPGPPPPPPTAAAFRVERATGNVYADGSYNCGLSNGSCLNTGTPADIAEYIDVVEAVEPGDVVELTPDIPGHFRRSRTPYSPLATGVISTAPGVVIGRASKPKLIVELRQVRLNLSAAGLSSLAQAASSYSSLHLSIDPVKSWASALSLSQLYESLVVPAPGNYPLLALMGRVPVKAVTETGPIRPGDLLTSSSTPGHAMRCPHPQLCHGAIIGKALEPLQKGQGTILMLVTR